MPTHSDPKEAQRLRERIAGLESVIRDLTRDEFAALIEASNGVTVGWSPDERYWFSGTAGAQLTPTMDRAIRTLWTRVVVGLAGALTASDRNFPGYVRSDRSIIARIRGKLRDLSLEQDAATLLEREIGPQVWRGATVAWNACCAALLWDALEPSLRESLQDPWRVALGTTPFQLINAQGRTGQPPRSPA